MYFNAWAGNNGPSGSQTDVGIAANEYRTRDFTPSDVFAFVNSGGIFDPNQVCANSLILTKVGPAESRWCYFTAPGRGIMSLSPCS
jgi:hypothetical protein